MKENGSDPRHGPASMPNSGDRLCVIVDSPDSVDDAESDAMSAATSFSVEMFT